MIFTSADKELEKLGFVKEDEDEKEAYYVKYEDKYEYHHVLFITHKVDGEHLIISYEKELNSDGLNNCNGLTYKETKAAMKKYREMKRKYGWK